MPSVDNSVSFAVLATLQKAKKLLKNGLTCPALKVV